MKITMQRLGASRLLWISAALASLLAVAGCAHQSASGSVYTYGQAQNEQIVRLGTVQSVRPITIQSDKSSGFGAASGAALGGVAGSTIGGGTGQYTRHHRGRYTWRLGR